MMTRFRYWLNTGDPCPGELAFATLLIAVWLFIAEFGLR